jgi:hypothetical protein
LKQGCRHVHQKDEETLPPRYAIESDDEDEFNPLTQITKPQADPIKVHITSAVIHTNVNLIVASGIAGKTWARGADLKEQSGIVSVNGVKVNPKNDSLSNPSTT